MDRLQGRPRLRRAATGYAQNCASGRFAKEELLMAKQLVQDVMTPQPLTFPDPATVADAARAMRESNIGDVLVTHEDQLCGIITDRDIVIRVVADNLDPMTTRLSAVCSDRPLTLAPTADIEQAVETM